MAGLPINQGATESEEDPSNMRILLSEILTFGGFFGAKFDILNPRWLLTAVAEPWSNGQTEGQINRLKTLKRAMYGRASTELLRARMIPLSAFTAHEK